MAALGYDRVAHMGQSGAVAQLGEAPPLQGGCRRFESDQLHHPNLRKDASSARRFWNLLKTDLFDPLVL